MVEAQKPRVDTWEDFAGEYLKVDLIKEFPLVVVAKDINTFYDEESERPRIDLIVEYHEKDWKIGLNKTNQQFLRTNGIKEPKAIIGKKITLDKTKVRNPALNTMVDSFVITKIE